MWDEECHATVGWEEMARDGDRRHAPICKTRQGSWELLLPAAAVWLFKQLSDDILYDLVKRLARYGVEDSEDGGLDRTAEQRMEALFPFLADAEVFVGNRYHWVSDGYDSLIDDVARAPRGFRLVAAAKARAPDIGVLQRSADGVLSALLRPPDASGEAIDRIGSFSANEVFGVLQFVLVTNTRLIGALPKRIDHMSTDLVDFSRSLVSVGGPIPNMYTRNLLYGDEIDLPFGYDLNPDRRDDVARMGPVELRRRGLDDERIVHTDKPNWRLVGRDGDPATVAGAPAVPKKADGYWSEDFFMITKTPNIHPSAEHRDALTVSGCHGIGSRAAITALYHADVLETIEQVAKNGYFQALGRVANPNPAGPIDPEHIRLSPDDVHPLSV